MMQGFFNLIKKKPDRRLRKDTYSKVGKPIAPTPEKRMLERKDPCNQCGLHKGCHSPKMKHTGGGKDKILIVAEAPGKTEDERGVQLIGEAGRLLRNALKDFGKDLDVHFWKTNAVICRPPNNRKPTRKELKLCKINLEKTIAELKPKFIWLMGGTPIESFFMDRFTDLSIGVWRRRLIPDYEHNCFVIPLFHPSYVLRKQDEKLEIIFKNDLKWALSCLRKELPKPLNIGVKILMEEDEVLSVLEEILRKEDNIVFDYETSHINSHLPNPKIWSIGVNGYSFGVDHPKVKYNTKEVEKLWKKILKSSSIGKVAHNLKFEDAWSRARFGVIPQNWLHDTMVTQHIVEYRPTSMSLKFQAFVKWGVPDYEREMKKYFLTEDNRKPNKLDRVPLPDLCRYNAIDTLLTKKLWECQEKELSRNDDLKRANKLFFEGILTFCDIESHGICVDDNWFDSREKKLTKQIDKIETKLVTSDEGRKFKRHTGRELKINSPKDLSILFFKVLKLKSEKKTKNGGDSVDVEALSKMDLPFVKELLKYRKLIKIRDTYIAQFKRGSIEGKIYPSFNLHTVDTYRSSSSSPNFQNIPRRDEDAKREVRTGIIPSKGNKLLEIDYSAMEVRICACETKDPELIKYIKDGRDMHFDEAKKIWIASDEEVHKEMRFHAKNGFVFPEIYGSYYKTCATNLWEEAKTLTTATNVPLLEHLRKKGVRTLDDFIEHVKSVEEKFWKKYPLIKKWAEENTRFYNCKGYLQFLFGHRRAGYLSRNALSNYPIQGTAFHCLLWSLIRINKIAKEERWKTKIIGQIHDSIVFDLYPPEQNKVIETTKEIMTKTIRKENKFLIVPLEVETEITDVDGSWYKKEKVGGE